MGDRIHVAEIYRVKHADSYEFTNRREALNRFLYENCPNMDWEGEEVECSERLEIPRSDLADLIGKVVGHRKYYEEWAKNNRIGENVDEFIKILASWISLSDQRNEFVVLTWF